VIQGINLKSYALCITKKIFPQSCDILASQTAGHRIDSQASVAPGENEKALPMNPANGTFER
jgi:hypothetical protein